MKLVLRFETSENPEDGHKAEIKNIEGDISIVYSNIHKVSRGFNPKPWLIGYAYNRELFLMYNITSQFDSRFADVSKIKTMHYSFYLGKEATNG